jgi:hypothetical protein
MGRRHRTTKEQKQKPSHNPFEPPPWPNDVLEWAIISVAGLGVGGGIFALIYLAHINGAI